MTSSPGLFRKSPGGGFGKNRHDEWREKDSEIKTRKKFIIIYWSIAQFQLSIVATELMLVD